MPLMPVDAASITGANPPWHMGPSLIELSAAVQSIVVCSSKGIRCCLNSTRSLSSADLALRMAVPLQQQSVVG